MSYQEIPNFFPTPDSLPAPPDSLRSLLEELGDDLFPLWLEHLQTARDFELPSSLLASSYWTLRLMREVAQRHLCEDVSGFRRVAYGFLGGGAEANGFGVAVLVDPPLLGEPVEYSFGRITVDGIIFPLIYSPVTGRLHGPARVPAKGSSGCWAVSRVSSANPLGPAILTAGHVAIDPTNGDLLKRGESIVLDDGSSGMVEDRAPSAIDAVLITTAEPPGTTRVPIISPWPPQGLQVEFVGQATGLHSTSVTLVSPVSHPQSAVSQMTFYLGDYGQRRDSGALVMSCVGQPLAAGLYLGCEQRMSSNVVEGVAQVGAQIRYALDMRSEVYI